MQHSPFKYLSLFVAGTLATLALAGCGTSSQDSASSSSGTDADAQEQLDDKGTGDESATSPSGSDGEALISYGDTTYTAQLQFCSLQGGEDALFHGATYDESGKVVGYLDGDFGDLGDIPYGEVRINFGATAQLESADTFIAVGGTDHLVVTDHSDTSLIIVGGTWDQDGTTLPTATLRVNC